VCPFSDPSRVNRCLSHAEAKSRKDVIEKHLYKVKSNGGDEQHPLNDPLWHSFDVVWFLTPRPRLTPKKRKLAKGSAQSRYYKRRKDKQEREEAGAKRRFDEGIIGEEEYKKYLIGDKRRKFIMEKATERRVRAEMQSQMEAVRKEMEMRLFDERKLRADIENKLQDLRTESSASGNRLNDNADAIASLEAAQQQLDDTGISAAALQEVLADQAANVVNFWADDRFLEATGMTYLQYYGFEWPTEVSETSFYTFATLLCPRSQWDGQLRSKSSRRHMQRELREYVESERQNLAESEEDVSVLNDIIQTFTSSCDLIQDGEERAAQMTPECAQKWLDEQEKLWSAAKAAFQARFTLDSQPPLQHFRLINDFADTWRAQKEASEKNCSAIAQASSLL